MDVSGRKAYNHWKRKMETKHLIIDQKIQNNPLDNLDTLGIIASFIPDNNLGKYHTKWCVVALLTRTAFRKYWREYSLETKCYYTMYRRFCYWNQNRGTLPRLQSQFYDYALRKTENRSCMLYPECSHEFDYFYIGNTRDVDLTGYCVDDDRIMHWMY